MKVHLNFVYLVAANDDFCASSKSSRPSFFSVPVPAKRPPKPKRSKNPARRNATVSLSSSAIDLKKKGRKKKPLEVYSLTF